ncbi:hypothetical protein [Candidatus Litorirhabdus singularis]|uniref:hypothetical protein n=1 Tax=Candidatus Litorirhabdus singularis TaxID=2518993 RepID=UPI0024324888|nr:hypothetical protein [Candidatus Litorirhabdus singularis]
MARTNYSFEKRQKEIAKKKKKEEKRARKLEKGDTDELLEGAEAPDSDASPDSETVPE